MGDQFQEICQYANTIECTYTNQVVQVSPLTRPLHAFKRCKHEMYEVAADKIWDTALY
jgi:hypothetical protein